MKSHVLTIGQLREQKLSNRGAVLIDAMMGIYLLALLALIYTAGASTAAVARAKADLTSKAASIVSRQLESIQNLGFSETTYAGLQFHNVISSTPATSPYSFTSVGSTSERVSSVLPSGTGSITVTDFTATVRRVTVTVNWTCKGASRTLSASTEVAKLN